MVKTRVAVNVIPPLMQTPILLPNISAITVLQRKQVKSFIPTFDFIRRKGPSIKFHNSHIAFKRKLDANYMTPVVEVKDLKGVTIESFSSAEMNSEEILQRVLDLDRQAALSRGSA